MIMKIPARRSLGRVCRRGAILPRRSLGPVCRHGAILRGLLAASALLFIPPVAQAEIVDGVAAIVNDDVITLSEVDEAGASIYQQIRRRFGEEAPPEIARARREVLDQLVNQHLMEQVIERYGISASDADVDAAVDDVKVQNGISQAELMEALDREGVSYKDYREEVRKQIQRTKLMRRQVRGVSEMTVDDAKTFYEKNPSLFEQDEQVLVRHILIATLPGTTDEERAAARLKAGKALARLNAGEDLAALAMELSAGPTAREGGSLGWISRGDTVPDFEAAIFSLEKGQTSAVVKTQIGYHIIRAEDRRAARTIPFSEVKESIKSRNLQKDMEGEFQKWLDKLRANAYVEKKL